MENSKNQISKHDQKDILSLAGTWEGSDEEAEKILNIINKIEKI